VLVSFPRDIRPPWPPRGGAGQEESVTQRAERHAGRWQAQAAIDFPRRNPDVEHIERTRSPRCAAGVAAARYGLPRVRGAGQAARGGRRCRGPVEGLGLQCRDPPPQEFASEAAAVSRAGSVPMVAGSGPMTFVSWLALFVVDVEGKGTVPPVPPSPLPPPRIPCRLHTPGRRDARGYGEAERTT
jgi:hypothetical protein